MLEIPTVVLVLLGVLAEANLYQPACSERGGVNVVVRSSHLTVSALVHSSHLTVSE